MRIAKIFQHKVVIWSFLFCFLALNFQNCGPNFTANSSSLSSTVAAQATDIIQPIDSNFYKPGQNLSFSYRKDLLPPGPLVWSNNLNSGDTCQEISASDADPYIVNCGSKGILSVSLVINSGGSNVIGPLTSSFVINDGVPRSSSMVPFIITNTTGDWNTPGQPIPVMPPLNLITAQIQNVSSTVVAHTILFKIDPKMFMAGIVPSWSLSAPGCTPATATSAQPQISTVCNTDKSRIDVTLNITGSDPITGPFNIAPMTMGGFINFGALPKDDKFAADAKPPVGVFPTPIITDANYIGPQELLETNVVFVGQTIRFFNKASATKQFGLSAGGPCAPTGSIPYSEKDDYSKYVDCKITSEFGDPAVGSALTNAYDPSQKFWLIALDGTRLYNQNCKVCHVDLNIARNQIGNETLARLKEAILGKANSMPMLQLDNSYANHLSRLSDAEKLAIIFALRN